MGDRIVRLFGGLGLRVALDLVQDPTQEVVLRGVRVRVPRLAAQLLGQAEAEERTARESLTSKTAELLAEGLRRELEAGERAEKAEARVAQLERELAEERTARAADRPAAVRAGVEAAREILATRPGAVSEPWRVTPVLTEAHRKAWRGRGGHA